MGDHSLNNLLKFGEVAKIVVVQIFGSLWQNKGAKVGKSRAIGRKIFKTLHISD